jgi:hypothetical protein
MEETETMPPRHSLAAHVTFGLLAAWAVYADGDGSVNLGDIEPFIALLGGP